MEKNSDMIHQDWQRAMAQLDAEMRGITVDLSTLPTATKVRLSVPCCECGQSRIFHANIQVDPNDPENPDRFELVPVTDGPCADCRERAERAERLAQLRSKLKAMFPPHLMVNDMTRLPAKQMAAVMAWKPTADQPGLLLHGPTGGAKTRLSIMKATAMAEETGREPTFLRARDFTHEVGQRFSGDWKPDYENLSGKRWIEQLCRTWLLIIDDICKGRVTARVETELFGLLDERFMHGRPTIISSNLDGAGLLKMFSDDIGAPLVRRLREYCVAVGFPEGCAR